jgi:glycerol-3-phosphate dehydrogenase
VIGPVERREADLRRLADESWDLLVVGGGIVGAGALLDAASRGLKVALIEQDDIAAGTSSRSSRLIHGGLRYLRQLDVTLVWEALHERARLLELAPHLIRLESFLFPLYGLPVVTRAFYQTGMTMYDVLGSAMSGGRHRPLSKAETLEYAPDLVRRHLRGGLLYHDGMEDDARYTVAVVRTALAEGGGAAVAATRVRATAPLRDGGRIAGATVTELVSGRSFEVRAAAVLDATGAWGSVPERPFGNGALNVLPARGSHLVIERSKIPAQGGMTLQVPGRVAFLVPWPRHWVIGTTDRPYHGPVDRVAAGNEEVDELLGTLNGALDLKITRDDLVGTFAGLRPLVAPSNAASSVKVSREHKVAKEAPGLVRVSGGKYTTYRVMARDAVDAVLGAGARIRPSRTAELRILGAAPRPELDAMAGRLARDEGIDTEAAQSLVDRHGTEAPEVIRRGRKADLLGPVRDGFPYVEAEIAWAVEEELALSLDDVLSRRLRLSQELRDRGESIALRVASIAGDVLGWDVTRQGHEVDAFLEQAHREYDVPAR